MSGGTAIDLIEVNKKYGDMTVVDKVSASIGAGEFVSLLGPSGSGKTTTLMMVAGFTLPTSGSIIVGGQNISRVPPQRRGFGMVFQNYSLFPHLNVFQNIAFPLKLRRMTLAEVEDRVKRSLDLVQLNGFGERRISQLSGGQQQRVALARAVVFQPKVVLMDEPMGALDKNLRFAMQTEIKEIQRRLGMTVLYVTHDQEEAMNMSDGIMIMNNGRIEQVGAPQDVYDRPETPFVAAFLGEANLIPGYVAEIRSNVAILRLDDGTTLKAPYSPQVSVGRHGNLFVRPERLRISPVAETDQASPQNSLIGTITRCSFLGSFRRYSVQIASGQSVSIDEANLDRTAFQTGKTVTLQWPVQAGQIIGTTA